MMVMVLGACGGSLQTPIRSSSRLVTHIGRSTVALVFTTKEGDVHPYCTGVWVKEDTILTAQHCVAAVAKMIAGIEDDEVEVETVGVKIYYIVEREVDSFGDEPSAIHLGKVQAVDIDHDLALIKVAATGIPFHEIADLVDTMPAVGEHGYVVGHPKGLYWSYVEVVVAAYRPITPVHDKKGPFVQVSGSIWYGNSGGGLFDSDGNLVGICSMLSRSPNSSLFIHMDSIKKFMKDNK